jgi:hypothetical protein
MDSQLIIQFQGPIQQMEIKQRQRSCFVALATGHFFMSYQENVVFFEEIFKQSILDGFHEVPDNHTFVKQTWDLVWNTKNPQKVCKNFQTF